MTVGALIARIGVLWLSVSRTKRVDSGRPSREVCSRAAASTWPSPSMMTRSRYSRLRLTSPRSTRSAAPTSKLPPGTSSSLIEASSKSVSIMVRLSAASAPLTKRATWPSVSSRASCWLRTISQKAEPTEATTSTATAPQIASVERMRGSELDMARAARRCGTDLRAG